MKKGLLLFPLLTLVALGRATAQEPPAAGFCQVALNGHARTYRIHVPETLVQPAPLVVALHGEESNALNFEKLSGFSALADREGFIVVYPEANEGQWKATEDVDFVRAIVEDVEQQYDVDKRRIFATGLSQGGSLASDLGAEAADVFAAVAPVTAPDGKDELDLAHPMSVMMIQGTADPVVPFAGLRVSVDRWCQANGISDRISYEMLPDRDPQDGCRVNRIVHLGGKAGSEVVVLEVQGGGHTWPGAGDSSDSDQGRVCRDFQAAKEIWSFFEDHPRLKERNKSRKSPQRLV